MFSIQGARYFLYNDSTDMRKSYNGLCGLVTNGMQKDPMNGDVYIFVNRPRNRIKLLRWEEGGFVLFCKRLERGTFAVPQPGEKSATSLISYAELVMLITGITMRNATFKPRFLPHNNVNKYPVNTHCSMV